MKIQENFGWLNVSLTDPSKTYVIGGSEEANERERQKYLGDDYKLSDAAKLYYEQSANCTSISRLEITSENYNDIMKIKGVPLSCLSGDYGEQVIKKMASIMDTYHSGELSAEDVKQKIKNICMDMRVEMVQERYTNGYNAKDNQQILEQIYGQLQKKNVDLAYVVNQREGAEIAAKYGGIENYDWMYYNSDYYYQAEDMKSIIRQTIAEMAEEWETDDIDFDKVEKSPLLALAGGVDYNKVWQHGALQRRCISLTDIEAVPPKNLTFFYQEKKVPGWDPNNKLEYQKGYVEVSYNNKTWSADVPYNMYGGEIIEFFHMQDFMEQYFIGDVDKECKDFLSKFDIFTEIWASTKGDSMWENCG